MILFVFSSVLPITISDNPSFGNMIYVDDDNTEGPWDGSQDHPYQHIQDAIDQAKDADKIIVNNGIYNEYIIINKSIQLMGENRETTILKNSDDNDTILIDNTNNVNIKNITIDCSSQEKVNGMCISQCNYCYFSNNKIIAKTKQDYGITIIGSHNIIENNIITGYNFSHGIASYTGSFNIITNNAIKSCLTGIYVFLSHENNIEKNSIVNCINGIYVEEANNNNIKSNFISNNQRGIFCSYASDNTIQYNNFISNEENAKFAKFLKTGFLISNKWKHNYWDDWLGFGVKCILGLIYIPTGDPIGIFIPWLEVDWHPKLQPNNVGV